MMAEGAIRPCGALPNVPGSPGVVVLACAFMGGTRHALGEVLYLAQAESMRRRVAALLAGTGKTGVHAQLRAFQEAGGEVDVLCAPLPRRAPAGLEAALLQEHLHRAGLRPAWNPTVPKARPSREALAEAERILDALRVGPR
jgi:hypothetical protein